VQLAGDLSTHVEQLASALNREHDEERIRTFIDAFLRPCGDRPVADVMAAAIVERADRAARVRIRPDTTDTPGDEVRPKPDTTEINRTPQDALEGDKPAKTLRVRYPASALRVWSTPETRRFRKHGELLLDPAATQWLDEHVRPGDVVLDVGAGVGVYALIAATHRGALTVAFEPAFATYKRLCDNILLNNCRRSVVPLPVAVGARSGLFELEYREDSPGEGHTVKERPWRAGAEERAGSYVQPVYVEPLDEIVRRHRLPHPNHVRVGSARAADAVLRGAARTLAAASMRSLFLAAPETASAALSKLAAAAGFTSAGTMEREDGVSLLFVRQERARGPRRFWPPRRSPRP
jgi:FkbM family methyltransferase